jgi:hypothetical protein
MFADPHVLIRALQHCEGFAELGMWPQVWEELEELPDEYRSLPPALLWRMRALVGLGFFQTATLLGRKLHELMPESEDLRHTMGEALVALAKSQADGGDLAGARDSLQECLQIAPERQREILEAPEFRPVW